MVHEKVAANVVTITLPL